MQINQTKWRAGMSLAGAFSALVLSGCGGGASGVASGSTALSGVGLAAPPQAEETQNQSTPVEGAPAELSQTSERKAATFNNPILKQDAADPWILRHGNSYYFTFTTGNEVQIWKSSTIQGLSKASRVIVWKAPRSGPQSRDIWAPEIHFLRGKWYIYFTATDGPDANRRLWVLEAKTSNPQGVYAVKAKLAAPRADEYAIDGTVFSQGDMLYLLWSGRENAHNPTQNIYIAPLSSPWKIGGPRIKIASPQYPWETQGWSVNEGPQALQRGGKTFITYSASGGTTPAYCLGLLSNPSGNLLQASGWQKSPVPVFRTYEGKDGSVYAPGHNSFTLSPDGKQNWMLYHAKTGKNEGWGGRLARAQPFTWNADGTPNFGHPIPLSVPIAVPSG